jgi:hypothetical protein
MPVTFARFRGRAAKWSLGLASAVAIASLGLAVAQEETAEPRDPLVVLTADGGDIATAGASVTITGTAADIQAAGASVDVRADATGDVQLAGAQVRFRGDVGGKLQIAGASVDVRGNVGGRLDAAGAVVFSNAAVSGLVRAAGANVTFGVGSDIAGDLKVAGANVTIFGRVGGKLDVAGGLVTINGQVDGDIEARGAQVVLGATARVAGDVVVYSLRDAIVTEGAEVAGTVTRYAPPRFWDQPGWSWVIGFALFVALGTMVAGIVLMLFGGRVFATAVGNVRHRPVSSFFFGILALVLIPFIAVVLMVTVIGLSVGLAILLIMPFLIVFGHATAAAGIAAGILMRRPGEIGVGAGLLMLILGAIVLVAVGLIPFAGPVLVAIALVLGIGAFTRTVGARLRRGDPPVMAAI